jgi:hypothetical protein
MSKGEDKIAFGGVEAMSLTSQKTAVDKSIGTTLGVWLGSAGAIVFFTLLFLSRMHGPYNEPVYPPVSYVFGNEAAMLEFYGTLATVFVFIAVAHASRHSRVVFLWVAAALVQIVFNGTFLISIHRLGIRRGNEFLSQFMQHAVPVPITVLLVATAALLTLDSIAGSERSTVVSQWRSILFDWTAQDFPQIVIEKRWSILAGLAGITVAVTGVAFSVALVLFDQFVVQFTMGRRRVAVLGFLVSWFVCNLVVTDSARLLVLTGATALVIGIVDFQYGSPRSGLLLPIGILLLVAGGACLFSLRKEDER